MKLTLCAGFRLSVSKAVIAAALLVSLSEIALADEQVRQLQEELRKRNLYFGDIDGQPNPELAGALKRYQTRKGFQATGIVDEDTATSLHVRPEIVAGELGARLPTEPILKSDAARQLSEEARIALLLKAEQNPEATPSAAPPAESPPPGQDLTPDRVTKFVEDYLRDAETSDVPSQIRYYSFPVRYFDHGDRGVDFVTSDTAAYVKRWPDRKYMLTGPVTFSAGTKDDETLVEFTIAYDVKRKPHYEVEGKTKNWWTVRPEGDDLKIIAIGEARVR